MLEPHVNKVAGLNTDSNAGVFIMINVEFSRAPILKRYPQTATSENLSCAAILIFGRYFRSRKLSTFYKIDLLKTSAKFFGKHICWSLFSIKLQTFSLKF